MREYRATSGKLIYYATRRELETLPGYRGNDRKGRACCPIHAGDNPTAFSIDWNTGWASCWSCGDAWALRVEDHPGAKAVPNRYQTGTGSRAPKSPPKRVQAAYKRRPEPHLLKHDLEGRRAKLETSIARAVEALPLSPGVTYLEARAIPLDVAQPLHIGWASVSKLAGRVVFPLCGPDGLATSATGRAVNEQVKPKYKALANDDGYVKTLFNGGAIAQAKRSGHPVIVVEGPLDAAACVAAGLPLTVALCGKGYAYPAHFHGLRTVILALDADDAGQDARRALWLDLTARGIEVLVLPAAALDGAKDLAEYWQRFRAMPTQLVGRVIGPHRQRVPGHPIQVGASRVRAMGAESPGQRRPPMTPREWPTSEELQQRTAEHRMTPDDLSADLKAEAEELVVELVGDRDVLRQWWADLTRREHLLTADDRTAAYYAVRLAIDVIG